MTTPADGAHGRSRLFTVRVWTEPYGDAGEHRGCARDIASGAFRSFRHWSDLTSFLVAQLDDDNSRNEDSR